jgi:hypothetical protein
MQVEPVNIHLIGASMAEFQKPSWENAMPTRTSDGLITLSSDELRQFAVDALLHDVHLHISGTKCTLATVITAEI